MDSSAGSGTFRQGINSVLTTDFPQGFHLFLPLFICISGHGDIQFLPALAAAVPTLNLLSHLAGTFF